MRRLLVIAALCLLPTPGLARLAAPEYDTLRAKIDARRTALRQALDEAAPDARDAVLGRARTTLHHAIRDELIPAWFGTPWDFYGATTHPDGGAIACGHFVATVLAHAGLQVERLPLGRQASEHIIQTLVPESRIERYRFASADHVTEATRARGVGVYVVGLDFHAGFLVVDPPLGEAAPVGRFCHATFLAPNRVLCEDPVTSRAFESDYRVVGSLADRTLVTRWLRGEPFPTVGNVDK